LFEVVKNQSARVHRPVLRPVAPKPGFANRFRIDVRRLPVDWSYVVLLILLSVWLLLLAGCSTTGHQVGSPAPAAWRQAGYPESVAFPPFAGLTDLPLIGSCSVVNFTETDEEQTVDDLSGEQTGRLPLPQPAGETHPTTGPSGAA